MNSSKESNDKPVAFALRVSQLDADDIDKELTEITVNQYKKVLDKLPLSDLSKFDPEALALFRFLFWYFSMKRNKCTLGQEMMDMSYVETSELSNKRTVYAYLGLTVIVPYLRERLSDILSIFDDNFSNVIERNFLHRLDFLLELFDTVHFLYFLNKGGYRNILERCLCLKAVHNEQPVIGDVDFSVMNRELIWHGFADVVIFILPWLKFGRIWNYFKRKIFPAKIPTNLDNNADDSVFEASMIISKDFVSLCSICKAYPVLPCHFGCGHCFCYYCIKANVEEDSNFQCPDCGCSVKGNNIKYLGANISI